MISARKLLIALVIILSISKKADGKYKFNFLVEKIDCSKFKVKSSDSCKVSIASIASISSLMAPFYLRSKLSSKNFTHSLGFFFVIVSLWPSTHLVINPNPS